jgi:N-acetylneuraminic acid mutarotase
VISGELRLACALTLALAAVACSGASTSHPHAVAPRSAKSTGATTPASATPATSQTAALAALSARVIGALPQGLSRTVAVNTGNGILVLSGLAPGDVSTSRVVRIDPSTGVARLVGQLTKAVHDASGAFLAGQAVVFGGGAGTDVSAVQAMRGTRATVIGHLPVGRSDTASATANGTAYVVGGFDGHQLPRDVLATTDGRSFRTVARLALGVRYPAVAAAAGAVWVIGGQLATTEGTLAGAQTSDIQRIDVATGRVTVAGHLPTTLGHASAFALGGGVYVCGGRVGSTASSRIWRLDPATGHVVAVGRLPMAYSDMAAVVVGSAAYLIGGETTGPAAPIRTILKLTIT